MPLLNRKGFHVAHEIGQMGFVFPVRQQFPYSIQSKFQIPIVSGESTC